MACRRGPEHPYPAAVEDAHAATQWVAAAGRERGFDPARPAVAGDSAGGTLATVAALVCRDRGGPAVRCQALAYPVTDHWQANRASADLSGLPPALIVTAESDPPRDQGRACARRLRAAGVTAGHVHRGDQMHGFLLLEATVDRARQAAGQCADAPRRGLP